MIRSLAFVLFLGFTHLVSAQGISFFHGSWEEALEKAQKEDKIIFVDAFAKWCGPCKKMAKTEFTQKEVGDFYNSNFINLKMDMEEKEGLGFGRKYPVSAYPTLFFLDSEGNILKKIVGGKKAADLIILAKAAINSYDRSDQYATLYDEGERDVELMINYVSELNKVGKPSLKISNDYMNSDPQITDDERALFLMNAVTEADSKLFDQLVALKSNAISQSSELEFIDKIRSAALRTVEKAVEFEYEELLYEAIAQFKTANTKELDKFEYEAKLKYHSLLANYDVWFPLSKKYLKKYGKKNPVLYKEHMSVLEKEFSHVPQARDYAMELTKELVNKEPNSENYMRYIRMLTSDNQHEEAIKLTKEAIKNAKSKKEDPAQFESLLDFLNKSME